MILPLKRYADFDGRSRRKEYWMFALLQFLVVLSFGFIAQAAEGQAVSDVVGYTLVATLWGLFIPSLAVTVRRFHDQGRSGWFVLLGLIPLIGALIVLWFMLIDGTEGDNRFGSDPKGRQVS